MKKIISLIAASTLAFALVSCNGDLHDDTNAPYTDAAQGKETEAYICGGLNGAKFEKMTKNEDGSFSFPSIKNLGSNFFTYDFPFSTK